MKARILSAIIMLAICIPPLIMGGVLIKFLAAFVVLAASYEFLSVRNSKINKLLFVSMIIFILLMTIFVEYQLTLILIYAILLYLYAIIFENILLEDISSVFMMSIIIAYAAHSVLTIYSWDNGYLSMLFILVAAFGCDIMALFTGMAIGKHKLNPRVSPKKTIEGAIGGWFFGALFSYVFAYFFIKTDLNFYLIAAVILPIIAQIGDLSFSLIKRNYKVKDFGNIIPGHGGILDRGDSLIFCLVFFIALVVFK